MNHCHSEDGIIRFSCWLVFLVFWPLLLAQAVWRFLQEWTTPAGTGGAR